MGKAKSALNELGTEAQAAQKDQAEQKAFLARIEITRPRFTKEKDSFSNYPTVSFTIANKETTAVKRVYLHGKVQTPGRAVPWVDENLNYEFPGGLEPNETKELKLTPGGNGYKWDQVPSEFLRGVVLDLTVTGFEDAAERRFEGAAKDHELDARKKALEDGIRTLERKITDLESQLKQGS